MLKKIQKNSSGKWYIFLCVTILALSFLIFRQYIIDGYYFLSKGLWSDLLRVNLPTYYQMFDSFADGGNFWSWRMGIGTSMFSHGDAYFDPFTYIIFLLGREHIPDMMVWMMVVKLIFEGISFFVYISYFKLDKRAGLIAAVLYAFSGYSLIVGNNFALGTVLVYAPIVFLGVEKWLDSDKLKVLILGLFLTAIYSCYFFIVLGLLTAAYVCLRSYQKRINPLPKLFVLLGIAIFVILLSAVSLLPQVQLILASPRVSDAKDVRELVGLLMPQFKVLITAFIRTISGDVLGNSISGQYRGYSYFGARDYFQVSCYTTAFFIILITQYWHNEKRNRKNLLISGAVMSLMILFPIFSFILNACSTVNARWMFIVTVAECLLVGFSFDSILKNKGLHGKTLLKGIFTSIAVVIVGMVLLSLDSPRFGEQFFTYLYHGRKYFLILAFLYLGTLGIYGIQHLKSKIIKQVMLYVSVIGILFVDEGINYYHCYGIEQSVSEYSEAADSSYQDTSAEIIQKIQERDHTFYRINKTFDSVYDNNGIPSCNDAMAQQYYGLKNYCSLNNSNYISFLKTLGIYCTIPFNVPSYMERGLLPEDMSGSDLNYISGVGNRYKLLDYFGVKYLISKESTEDLPSYFHNIDGKNQISVYENECCYPLGFVNTQLMSLEEFQTLSDEDKDYALLQYTIVEDETSFGSPLLRNEQAVRKTAREKQNAFQLISFSQDRVVFQIDVPAGGKYLSLSMPFDKDWHIYVDGVETNTCKINVALLGAEITEGVHEIELYYQPKALKLGIIITILAAILVFGFCRTASFFTHKLETAVMAGILWVKGFTKKEAVRKSIISLLKHAAYAVIALSLTFVSILVIYPSAFIKAEIEEFQSFDNISLRGYQLYGNQFIVTKDDPGMEWENHIIKPVSNVTVCFSSVDTAENHNRKMMAQLFYRDDTEEYTEEKSVVRYVDNDNLTIQFELKPDEITNFRLDIGTLEKEAFQLESIYAEGRYFEISIWDYLVIGIISAFVFGILLFLARKLKKKTSDITRDSNIELCRIICMLLIIAHHCVVHGGAYNNIPELSFNRILSLFLVPAGKLCFDCFLAISCWYLVDQSFRTKRFIRIWLQILSYSVLFSLAAFALGKAFTFRDWVSVLLPITGNSHGFAAAYLAFYLLLPFLSMISERLTKRQARWLFVLLFYFEVFSKLVGAFTSYYQPLSSELTLFVFCYVAALNLKRWPLKICENRKAMIGIFIVIWASLWMVRYSAVRNPGNPLLGYIMGTMCDESSITNLIGGFALFFFFKNMKIKRNPVINYLATGTFGILLFHDHNFFRYVLWEKILKTRDWYYTPMFVVLVVGSIIWIFAVGFVLEQIRKRAADKTIYSNARLCDCCDKCDNVLKCKK